MSLVPIPHPPRRSLRAALLGAVAVVALGAVAFENGAFSPGYAVAATTQPSAGPASFADVVDRVKSSVVSVKVKVADGGDAEMDLQGSPHFPPGSPFDRFFKQFGLPDDNEGDSPMPHRQQRRLSMAQGSGFFISADGYIVTNNHVVDHATEVTITTSDGKTMPAKVIGTDPKTDIALLKVKGEGTYPFVDFASQSPRVGDWVIAVGNPFGLGGTVTAGIVSARGRDIGSGPYDDFLQIDAPVNHGNSGGPTFNTDGEVVGVNTAIFSPSGGSVGIGFAIASDVVKNVVQQLKDNGVVERGWLGVEIQQVTPDLADSLGVKNASGALVAKETTGSPAATAGVKVGDVITAVERRNGRRSQGSGPAHRRARAEEVRRSRDLAQRRAADHRRDARRHADGQGGQRRGARQGRGFLAPRQTRAQPRARARRRGRRGRRRRSQRRGGRPRPAGRRRHFGGGRQAGHASRRSRPGLRGRQVGRPQIGVATRQVRRLGALSGVAGEGGVLISRAWPRLPCEAISAGRRAPVPRPCATPANRRQAVPPTACRHSFGAKPGSRYMSSMRILIIEDDRDAAAYLVKAFREAGSASTMPPTASAATIWRRKAPTTSPLSTACCPRWTDCR